MIMTSKIYESSVATYTGHCILAGDIIDTTILLVMHCISRLFVMSHP